MLVKLPHRMNRPNEWIRSQLVRPVLVNFEDFVERAPERRSWIFFERLAIIDLPLVHGGVGSRVIRKEDRP
jgi:hypothetical protein